MGMVYADITLKNPREDALKSITVNALVDTGAHWLCIPKHVALQLGLSDGENREVTLANGDVVKVPYVGPLQINFENRMSFSGALIFGDQVLLGAIPMEDMDVVISPLDQKMVVNPRSPNIASGMVKLTLGAKHG